MLLHSVDAWLLALLLLCTLLHQGYGFEAVASLSPRALPLFHMVAEVLAVPIGRKRVPILRRFLHSCISQMAV